MSDAAQWFGFVELAPGASALVAEAPAAPPADVRVSMTVAGGMPDEGYSFRFTLEPDGSARCEWEGVPPGPNAVPEAPGDSERSVTFSASHILDHSLELAGVASSAPMQPPEFPPDSLIGRLQVETSEGRVQTFFMADEEQARTAGLLPPEEIHKLTDEIYAACEEAAHVPKLRP